MSIQGLWSTVVCAVVVLCAAQAGAVQVGEWEGNDTPGTANVFGPSTTRIRGSLDRDFSARVATTGSLAPGEIDKFRIWSMTPGQPFFAFTATDLNADNDTIMRTLDANFNPIASDDDGGPLRGGNGRGSGLSGTVNPDGSINIDVTGFSDFGFNGSHAQQGGYDLYIQVGTTSFSGSSTAVGDPDFFMVTGLTPGERFQIEVVDARFDSVLGVFDETGTLLKLNDDGPEQLKSQLTGRVNADGTALFAISEFADFGFNGADADGYGGAYTIEFHPGMPEPTTLGLLGLGGLLLGGRRRR